jgi:hypothetical protein
MDAAETAGSVTAGQTVVLPFPGPLESIPQATEFRSTWLTSSLEGLRQHGHFERYLTLLEGYQDEILTSVAASWIPLEVARTHYQACERLQLKPEQIEAMARAGGNVRRAWYANTIASAQRPGVTVWVILQQLQKFWLRSANGGAVAVFQLDANSARLHYVGCSLFDITYFREAFRVVLLLLVRHVDPNIVMTTLPSRNAQETEYGLTLPGSRG